jgi:hypothetical protein
MAGSGGDLAAPGELAARVLGFLVEAVWDWWEWESDGAPGGGGIRDWEERERDGGEFLFLFFCHCHGMVRWLFLLCWRPAGCGLCSSSREPLLLRGWCEPRASWLFCSRVWLVFVTFSRHGDLYWPAVWAPLCSDAGGLQERGWP